MKTISKEEIIQALSTPIPRADFSGIHCSDIDLSDQNLALVSLQGSNFRGSEITGGASMKNMHLHATSIDFDIASSSFT